MKKAIPSIITSANLFCGFAAILINDPQWSPLLILLGAVFDLFDGMVARLLKAGSEFGKQLDSLADLVTFGVAPAYLYYFHISQQDVADLIIISLLPVFSAVRLAIFNIDETQTKDFKGLATPANAIFFLSFPLIEKMTDVQWFQDLLDLRIFVLALPVIFSYLLVSPLRMFSFKSFGDGFKNNPFPFIFIGLVLISVPFLNWICVPVAILMYIFLSVFYTIFRKSKS